MFVYLFVWETLGIPQRHQRETTGRPAGTPETPQQANETKSGLVNMSLIETHQQEHQIHHSRPETPEGDQRKARCNYPINYLKFY